MADDLTNCKAVTVLIRITKQHIVGMSRFQEHQEMNLVIANKVFFTTYAVRQTPL